MFEHNLNQGFTKTAIVHWYLLAFLSGSVNAGGFMACERFVTHVTGFATLSGIEVARGNGIAALGIMSVPVFFLGGVMVAAWLTVTRKQRGLRPRYATTMGLIAMCLFVVAIGGTFDLFGVFGTDFYLKHDYLLLALLCTASGLQNATITTATGSTVRTTHLTGITTDLGIGLVEAFEARTDTARYRQATARSAYRLGTIVAFLLGGSAGAVLFLNFKYLGFLLPMAIALFGVYVARRQTPRSGVA
jgi:uncharacterized membrane protein YoaK (UPF0700 family)